MLNKCFLLIFILTLPLAVRAEFKTADEAMAKLKSYKAEDFKRTPEKSEEKSDAHEDQFFDDLDEAVKFATANKVNQDFLVTVAEATSLSLKNDDTAYAGEIVLPLFKKDKKAFKAALKKLSKKDAEQIEESFKDKERENKSGNG